MESIRSSDRQRGSAVSATPTEVAIVADDLTGALDAGAPFASLKSPLSVTWVEGKLEDDRPFSHSSESRNIKAPEAVDRTVAALNSASVAGIVYKKVDSLMRGNTFEEIAACQRLGRFRSIILCPAFPAQERRMVGGVLVHPNGAIDVTERLVALGASVGVTHSNPEGAPESGLLIADAQDDVDLRQVVARGLGMAEPRLWCGSAGLARALALARRQPRPVELPASAPDLIVIGSRSNRARADLAYLGDLPYMTIEIVRAFDSRLDRVRIGKPGQLVIGFELPESDTVQVQRTYEQIFANLVEWRSPPPAVLSVGGDTTRWLLGSAEAEWLDLLGEFEPGLAVSRVSGGLWDGTLLYSRSGSFASPGYFESVFGGTPCDA